MKHSFRFVVAFLALLMLPAAVSAQKDSRYTRETNKYIGLAMTRQDDAERTSMYQQALTHVREGMEKEPGNAKIWLLGGSVLAALGQAQEADAAFEKAVELHPDYAADVRLARHEGWVESFNRGAAAMDAQQYDEAIRHFEGAQALFDERPEALMNLGVLYANAGDIARAEQALRAAEAATRSALFSEIGEEEQAQWLEFRETAPITVSTLYMNKGIEGFQAQDFEAAFAAFAKAAEVNPYSRDAVFNQAQALWAQASAKEDALQGQEGDAARAGWREVIAIYEKAQPLVQRARQMDPHNEALFVIESNLYRAKARAAATDAERDTHAAQQLKVLEAHAALPFVVDEVGVVQGADGPMLVGKVTNKSATEGSSLTLRFTLLGLDGRALGEQIVTVPAPAVDAVADFEVPVTVEGQAAGWKYTVGS